MNESVKECSLTIGEWKEYLSNKSEHYPISDEFIKKYQQSPANVNGYVYYAWKTNRIINKEDAEPDQKWHFELYISGLLNDKKISIDDSAEKIYRRIVCPELLLWIAEACGINEGDIEEASSQARNIINEKKKWVRNSAGRKIHELIPWTIIEKKVKRV